MCSLPKQTVAKVHRTVVAKHDDVGGLHPPEGVNVGDQDALGQRDVIVKVSLIIPLAVKNIKYEKAADGSLISLDILPKINSRFFYVFLTLDIGNSF